MSAPTTARERARTEITREILQTGREHLARDGAAALSLRAVARDLGMASSAVYRYVPNRDALLTMLIIAAYDSLGEAVEKAEAAVPATTTAIASSLSATPSAPGPSPIRTSTP